MTVLSTAAAAAPLVILVHIFISPRVVAVPGTALNCIVLVAVAGVVAAVAALRVFRRLFVVAVAFACC